MTLNFGGEDSAEVKKSLSASQSLPLATVSSRIIATFIDVSILFGLNVAVVLLTQRLAQVPIDLFTEFQLFLPLFAFLMLLDCGYVVALTTLGGQTIGKMMMGIKVVRRDDGIAGFRTIVIRTAIAVVSVVPFGVGYLYAFVGKSHAVHDVLANTKVVRR